MPRSPKQIADSAIAAAKAGAAVVHCHVRDPDSGVPSRKLSYYREVTERIRNGGVDVVLNLTAGMGGDVVFGGVDRPLPLVLEPIWLVRLSGLLILRNVSRNLHT